MATPLLEESWRMCRRANAAAQQSFAVDREGKVAYVAFSGVQEIDCSEESSRGLVELESGGAKGIFGGFGGGDDGKEPIMVHGGLLQLFLIYRSGVCNLRRRWGGEVSFELTTSSPEQAAALLAHSGEADDGRRRGWRLRVEVMDWDVVHDASLIVHHYLVLICFFIV